MPHQTLIPWTKKLTILAALIALVATIYAFGATTPQDALASAMSNMSHSTGASNPPT